MMPANLINGLKTAARRAWPGGYAFLAAAAKRIRNIRSPKSTFANIYQSNGWSGEESISGPGSDLDQTRVICVKIPELISELGIRTMLDAPCGDLHWIKNVELGVAEYIGGDIVPALVESNSARFAGTNRSFRVMNLISDPLPKVDLVFCRDCLVHLPLREAAEALRNIKRSGSEYLLTTTFPATRSNAEVIRGLWRPLNLTLPPFRFPPPLRLINEGCTEQGGIFKDKSLGLWRVDDLLS